MKKAQQQMIQLTKASEKKQQNVSAVDLVTTILDYFNGFVPLREVLAVGERLQKQTDEIPAILQLEISGQLQSLQNQKDLPDDIIGRAAVEDKLCNVLEIITSQPPKSNL
jgi:hypothetical protein